jgi:hypothetical protein
MSLFRKNPALATHEETSFFLELSPNMKPISEFKKVVWDQQLQAIQVQQKAQSDLNRVMQLGVAQDETTTTYSMLKPFKNLTSLEKMRHIMLEHDVSMRLNVMRNDAHLSTHTCMQLSSDSIKALLASEADAKGLKTLHLRTTADADLEVAASGDMFVTVHLAGGQHFFNHVDYSINNEANAALSA